MKILTRFLTLSYRQKTVLFASVSLAVNVFYAVYNGIISIYYGSIWFVTLSVYYVLLGLMRFQAVHAEYRLKNIIDNSEKFRRELKVLKTDGILLLLLAPSIIGTTTLTIAQDRAEKYGTIAMITIAAYTTLKITMAVRNAIKVHKHNSPVCSAIRNITFADAAVSILPMQSSMIVSFEENHDMDYFKFMTAAVGAGIFIIILCLGISMIVPAYRQMKKQ